MNIIDIFPQLLKIVLQFGFQVPVVMHITYLNLSIVTTEHGVSIRQQFCPIRILTIFYFDVLSLISIMKSRRLLILKVLSLSHSLFLLSTNHIWNGPFMVCSVETAQTWFLLTVSKGLMRFLSFDRSLISYLGTTSRKAAIFNFFVKGRGHLISLSTSITMNSRCVRSCIKRVFESIAVMIGRHIFWIVSRMQHGTLLFIASKVIIINIIESKLFLLLILSRHCTKLSSNSWRRNHLLVDSNGHISRRI